MSVVLLNTLSTVIQFFFSGSSLSTGMLIRNCRTVGETKLQERKVAVYFQL